MGKTYNTSFPRSVLQMIFKQRLVIHNWIAWLSIILVIMSMQGLIIDA